MNITLRKYGGSSLATDEQIAAVAEQVAGAHGRGTAQVVVVSARGDTTDALIRAAGAVSVSPQPAEVDKLLATGEVASAALLAIALRERDVPAVSLTGPQAGLRATGRPGAGVVTGVEPGPVRAWLDKGHAVIVAGFQARCDDGTAEETDVITLGRGGSDTSAIALAIALGAPVCEIYTDVDGVHAADPRLVPGAPVLPAVDARVMAEMAVAGARVLHCRAVELAAAYDLDIVVRNTAGSGTGSTIVGRKTEMLHRVMHGERADVVAVTHELGVARVVVRAPRDHGLTGVGVLDTLADMQITADAVGWAAEPHEDLHLAFCVPGSELEDVRAALTPRVGWHGSIEARVPLGKVSIVGAGLLRRPALTAELLGELATRGIGAECIACTPSRTSLLVPEDRVPDSVATLFHHLGLDDEKDATVPA